MSIGPEGSGRSCRYLIVHRSGEPTTTVVGQLFGDAVAQMQQRPGTRIRHLALEVDDHLGTATTSLILYFDA